MLMKPIVLSVVFRGTVAGDVSEFRGKTGFRNQSFATIEGNYMTGEDKGCCCLTG
jgi:hypothetical protein